MNRKIRVKVGDKFSQLFDLDNGTPQGSIISPIVFIILINSMFRNTPDSDKGLYMDDGLLWSTGNDIETVMDRIQNSLNAIGEWGKEYGIKFSTAKTKYMIFTKKKETTLLNANGQSVNISLYGANIERVFRYRYLGMIFDPWLTWGPHISDLVHRCQKPINVMQAVAYKSWGADRKSLLNLYGATVLSKINYGSFIYGSAAEGHLEKLDRVQYMAVRLILGNMRCTLHFNLEPEANIMPLKFRRALIGLQYMSRIYKIQNHITKWTFDNYFHYQFYDTRRRDKFPLPVVGRLRNMARDLNIPLAKMEKVVLKDAFIVSNIITPFSMKGIQKDDPTLRQKFLELRNEYIGYVEAYTDGSKDGKRTGCAFIIENAICKYRLPKNCSILTAELYAIYRCLLYIKRSTKTNFVIFCDSQSAIFSIAGNSNKHAMQIRIHKLLNRLRDKHIVLEYVPSHVGIEGNEQVDRAARDALQDRFLIRLPLNVDEISCIIKKKVKNAWQREWNRYHGEYRNLKPILGDWKSAYRESRREEVILSRLRTDCSYYYVQHHFPWGGPPQTWCERCQVYNKLNHLIIECPLWNTYRGRMKSFLNRKGLNLSMINVLDDKFDHSILFSYLRDIKFYDKI